MNKTRAIFQYYICRIIKSLPFIKYLVLQSVFTMLLGSDKCLGITESISVSKLFRKKYTKHSSVYVCLRFHPPQSSLLKANLNQTQVSHISGSPWAALDLNALSQRHWLGSPQAPLPQGHAAGCLPVCLEKKKKGEKNMSRYFYCSALWSSHRLLKQSPLINIYNLSDGMGSMERGEREERVSLNNHHPSTSSPLPLSHPSEVEVRF